MAVDGSVAAERRKDDLRRQLTTVGHINLDEAAATFGVHAMTIRRDLQSLESEGVARRVRGGAVYVGPAEFTQRVSRSLTAKRRIADKLIDLVPAGSAIGIDASTTVFQLIPLMSRVPGLQVITHGLPAFEALNKQPGLRAFLTGGEQDERTGSLVGPIAQKVVAGFSLSVCFLSANSVDPEIGVSDSTMEEVEMKEALAGASARTVLAIDSSKVNTRSLIRSLKLDQIDVLVTELAPSDPRLGAYQDLVEVR
ncbi:DeoR/GlpR transcriptional regulator [Nakamurella silvestris]|nr:DeoR/GlpR transcriptional regulator [Nakamurella silvestris]